MPMPPLNLNVATTTTSGFESLGIRMGGETINYGGSGGRSAGKKKKAKDSQLWTLVAVVAVAVAAVLFVGRR